MKYINLKNIDNNQKTILQKSFSEDPSPTPEFQEVLNGMDQMFPREERYKPYEFRDAPIFLWLCAVCDKEYGENTTGDRWLVNNAAEASGYNNVTHSICPQHHFEYYGKYPEE